MKQLDVITAVIIVHLELSSSDIIDLVHDEATKMI